MKPRPRGGVFFIQVGLICADILLGMARERGFSLIEALIAVAIIAILSAIIIPHLMGARMRANEAAAVLNLKAIQTAQNLYSISYPHLGYADRLQKLGPPPEGESVGPHAADLINPNLACPAEPCPQGGYYFAVESTSGSPVAIYYLIARPIVPGQTGRRRYRSMNDDKLPFEAEDSPIVKDSKPED